MPDLVDREGKLSCPSAKCGAKVPPPPPLFHSPSLPLLNVALLLQIGSWNWAGSQCSCGQWVAPAMQFPMSKVCHVGCDPKGPGRF
jgi:hypothetical protein